MNGDVFLKIDRVVLHGMEHVDAGALATALQDALAEHLGPTALCGSANAARARTRIDLPEGFTAGQLGRALAGGLLGVIAGAGARPETGRIGASGGREDA